MLFHADRLYFGVYKSGGLDSYKRVLGLSELIPGSPKSILGRCRSALGPKTVSGTKHLVPVNATFEEYLDTCHVLLSRPLII
jgi:hypothetical protein